MKLLSLSRLRVAEREASWFFQACGGKVPNDGDPAVRAAAEQIDGWLRELPAFHRGVLALRFVPREWPKAMEEELCGLASVVVRLECALHPTTGVSTKALEQASLERLLECIHDANRTRARWDRVDRDRPLTRSEKHLRQLVRRAHRHAELAVRALTRTRGLAPYLLPALRRS